jgi:hypothetical protein
MKKPTDPIANPIAMARSQATRWVTGARASA